MNKLTRIAVILSVVAAPVSAGGTFGPTPYLSSLDSPFTGSPFAYNYLETFEFGLGAVPGYAISGGSITSPGAFTDSVDADDGMIDGSGNAGRSYIALSNIVDITFDALVLGSLPTHVGFAWTDVGAVSSGDFATGPVTVDFYDASNLIVESIGPVILGNGTFTGETAEDRFFGAISAGGVSRIRISMPTSVDWEIDHVQYALIPAPGATALAALAGLAGLRRRRIAV